MGQAPKGFKFPKALDQFGVPHGETAGGNRKSTLPNGNDFWWHEWAGNTGNCWFDNTGADGTAGSVTGPGGHGTPPDVLPSDCATSVGPGDDAKTAYLIDCGDGPDEDTSPLACDWWQPPPPPGSRGRRSRPASHRAGGGALGGVGRGRGASRPAGRAWLRSLSRGRACA